MKRIGSVIGLKSERIEEYEQLHPAVWLDVLEEIRNYSIFLKKLPDGLDIVRSCPGTTFVLDHCGVPDIAGNGCARGEGFEAWSRGIRALAGQPNVYCKLSGLLLYAGEEERSAEGVLPYAREVFDAFGPGRVVWGGDWPVCTLAVPLADWVAATRTILERCGMDEDEREAILEGNARSVYRLTG